MDRMQEEAMRRVREMQSGNSAQQQNRRTSDKIEKHIESHNESVEKAVADSEQKDLVSELFKDKEKLLILLLIMILSQESTNTELVLALLYIII
ncbi:MAG: hypothetical protein E7532_01850 [Ruminococcaceae bacterium]|nr:hypothetical protein [Oscillospiraceae bacterium]